MNEEWRDIAGYEGSYVVSSFGRVRGPSGKILKPQKCEGDYLYIVLSTPSSRTNGKIARLVCIAFHGPPPFEGAYALHKDDDRSNNRKDNLYWGDRIQNWNDVLKNGNDTSSKINMEIAREIRARVANGEKPFRIQGEYGLSSGAITNIVHNKTWKEPACG